MLFQRAPALSGRANAVKTSSPATPRHLLHHLPFTPRTSPPTTQGATELKRRRDVRQASWLDNVQEAVTIGAVTGSLVGIAYSAVVTSAASRHTPPHSGSAAGSSNGGEDNFVWGLMGFISCLPLFNWLAWILAGLQSPDRSALYYTYAGLYALPLLTEGLELDAFTLGMLLLCIAHVQVERLAVTEPATLQSLSPLAALGRLLRLGATSSASYIGEVGREVGRDTARALHANIRHNKEEEGQDASGSSQARRLGPGTSRDVNQMLWRDGQRMQAGEAGGSGSVSDEEYDAMELARFDAEMRVRGRTEKGGQQQQAAPPEGGRAQRQQQQRRLDDEW